MKKAKLLRFRPTELSIADIEHHYMRFHRALGCSWIIENIAPNREFQLP